MLGRNSSTAKAVLLTFALVVSTLAMPLVGTVAAQQNATTLEANGEYDQGAELVYDTGLSQGDTVELRESGSTTALETYTVDSNGEVLVDTATDHNGNAMEGDYVLYDTQAASNLVSFSVVDNPQYQEITANSDLFWQGQTLSFDDEGSFSAGEEVTLRVGGSGDDAGDFVQQYSVQNDAGDIVIDTEESNLDGQYTIHNGSGDQVGSFEVVEQNLSVTAEDSDVSNNEGGDSTTTFEFDSNRAGYTVQVTEENDSLSAEEIGEVFGGSVSQTDMATISMNPPTAGETSTHTVTANVQSGGSSLNGVTVDYSNSDADISNVGMEDVVAVGIDEGDDSSGDTVDVDVSDDLSSVDASNNGAEVTFGFDGSYSLETGDEVVVVYEDVQNPTDTSETQVPVEINPQSSGNAATASLYTTDSASEGAAFFRIDNTDQLDADFANVEDGEYTFNFEVVDTGVSDTAQVGVDASGDASAEFVESIISEDLGDVADVTVDTTNVNQFTITFGDAEQDGYSQSATVNVDEGVDEVTLQFNTYEAGTGATPWSLHEDSQNDASLSQTTDTELSNPPIVAGDYDLELTRNGDLQATGLMTLDAGELTGSTTHTAPTTSSISELEDLEAATETDTVAEQDKFVFEVDADGFYGYINEDTTAADLEKGSAFDDEHGVYVEIEDQDPRPNTEAETLDVSQGTLLVDEDNGKFYLVFDEMDFDSDAVGTIEDGDTFELSFHQTEANAYIEQSDDEDNSVEVSSEVSFTEREYNLDNVNDDDVVEVAAQEGAEVTGTTTVAPGTQLTILAQSGSPNPFTQTSTVEVAEDRTFTATYNLSDANDGQEFALNFRDVSKTMDAVAVGDGMSDLTVNVEDANGDVVDADVTVNGNTQTATDGEVVFEVEDGEYTVEVSADGYETASQSVTVEGDTSATVTLTESTQTATPSPTETPEDTDTPVDDTDTPTESMTTETPSDGEDTPDEDTTTTTTPGFGAVVAILALLGVIGAAVYRNQ